MENIKLANNGMANDIEDLICLDGMAWEANLQLPDPELVSYWKDYKNRVIYLIDDIGDNIMIHVKNIIRWNKEDEDAKIPVGERKKIFIFLNSFGGSIDACLSLIQAMKFSKTPVVTVNIAVAASAAGLILMSGTKGYRYCMPYSWALVHQGSSSSGTATFSQMESAQANYRKIQEMMEKIIFESTKIDAKEYKKIKSKENYFYAQDQVDKGICDYIVTDITQII